MRIVKNPQMQFGEIDISEIKFNPKSRDDIPKILKGLQFIYTNENIRLEIFKILEQNISLKISHILLKKKENDPLRGRCDSFVVETNVHFLTDINLLFDAIRKVITLITELCEKHGLSDWRQHKYNIKQVKRLMRSVTARLN